MPPKRKRGGKVSNGSRGRKGTQNNHLGKSRMKKEARESSVEIEDSKKLEELNEEALSANILIERVKKKKQKAEITRIQCAECNKIFRYRNNFKRHLENEHSKLPNSVRCGQCPVRCPNNAVLQEHIETRHKGELYECPDCKKKFVRSAHVLRHMVQKGCSGTKMTMYPCEICCAQFSRKDNLMVHLRLQHISSRKYACKECPFSTATFSKLIIHKLKYHTEGKGQWFECDHCNKVVTSRAAICKHLEIHGEKKFACDVCGYSTYTVEVMRRHVLTHVREKPYKCQQCERSFIQRSQLLRHQERHFSAKCQLCYESFTSKAKFQMHMKKRHGKKVPKIEKVGEQSCEVCGKSFSQETMLRKHMLSHTLERPRRCMYCVVARAYVRGEQLVKHVRKMHPAVFSDHLAHVRQVLDVKKSVDKSVERSRVSKSELDAILNVMDAEADRILQGYGEGVLYGGMQEPDHERVVEVPVVNETQVEYNPLMSEEELANNLNQLLVQLIDKDLLECFGWPSESVDTVLEKVIENCGAKPADREKWSRVQRLRENAKHLFLYVIDDKNIARMLDSHTIDQIVKHILTQVTEDEDTRTQVIINDDMEADNLETETVVEKILPLE